MTEQQERALAAGLKALAATSRNARASEHVEQAVLAEMLNRSTSRRKSRAWLPVAASLVIASASGAWLAREAALERNTVIRPSGFVAVPGAALLPPLESASIVRVEVAVTELPSYGIQIVPEIRAAAVQADLLVAQDGQPRAIRLVHQSESSRSTP